LVFLQTNWKPTIKAKKALHKQLEIACPEVHKVRMKALMAGVGSATQKQVGGHTDT